MRVTYHTPINPRYCARLCSGVNSATISIALEKMPAAPTPAMARPRINTFMEGETPHTREPTSKMKTANIMTCFEGKIVDHCE